MTREEGYKILNELIKNPNLIKHHLAAEAVMKALVRKFMTDNPHLGLSEAKWGLVGLLHDADYELTKDDPPRHSIVLEEKIGSKLEPDVLYAIKAHNWRNNGVEPKRIMDWSMYCCDELTGLIIAAALIHPDKKLSALTPQFVINRYNEKSFAKGADRKQIAMCEQKLGIKLPDFINLALTAMQQISKDLGL
ncbi:MAG: phosphohydrolase [bacterium]|nr:phosphohydrolase [bacterium]